MAKHIGLSTKVELASRRESEMETGLEEPDGLSVHMLRIAPGGTLATPQISLGFAASMLVVNGDVEFDKRSYSAWSCFYAGRDEEAITFQAGPEGAEVLYLRFPRSITK